MHAEAALRGVTNFIEITHSEQPFAITNLFTPQSPRAVGT